MTANEVRLTLYSRNYCHLCHDMLAALEAMRGECSVGFVVEVVDVDAEGNAALVERYDELVPVLVAWDWDVDGAGDAVGDSARHARELCHYFLDKEAVRAYLDGFPLRAG